MQVVTAHIDNSNFKTTVRSESGNIVIADEPKELGGANLGFSPSELLLSALASCTAITLRMYADRKKWNLIDIIVDAAAEKREDDTTFFSVTIKLFGDLESEQKKRLLEISKKCPIHKTLLHATEIETRPD